MAVNNRMHPRNPYRSPPDFDKLAKMYPEFSEIAKADVTGKVTINFKDPHALRVLTKCLLKSDFDLDVDIPEDRLVPTLPLRLNYILWIEDLLLAIGDISNVRGLDIGTGACAIYPLLAAVNNKWHMIGTETDVESLTKAKHNVSKNNLQELIELKFNPSTSVLDNLFTEENIPTLHFCMCNPPFYSNIQELCEARSPARPPPKNGFTGSPHELITEGGELEFCRKLISESKKYPNSILIFTTMVGHKYNLQELLQDLKANGIKHTHTEFCQGRVTRWGVAWTYNDYDIYKLVPPRGKPHKKIVPMVYILPELPNHPYNVDNAYGKIKEILHNLSIRYKLIEKKGKSISIDIVATVNTWSNQRRKRRLMKQSEEFDKKKQKVNAEADIHGAMGLDHEQLENKFSLMPLVNKTDLIAPPITSNNNETQQSLDQEQLENESTLMHLVKTDLIAPPLTDTTNETQHLVHAFIKVLKKDNDIIVEFDFLDGKGGKESLHQIVQFIKNKWK